MEHFVTWALATLVGAFVGSYLSSYLKTKGENLATHEDIDKLLEQVSAVTTTTKEIEAKISSDVWDRQKRWELKRDALFEALKNMGIVEDKLSAFHAIYETDERSMNAGGSERPEKASEAYRAFNDAANDLDRAILILALVCNEQLSHDVLEFGAFSRDIANKIIEGQPHAFLVWGPEFVAKKKKIMDAMRKELHASNQ